MTGFEYDNANKCIGDLWKDTILDPVYGRDDVPKSFKRNGLRLSAVKSGSEIKRVTIHPKTTDKPEQWVTSDTWVNAGAME